MDQLVTLGPQALAQRLVAAGCQRAFGIPGGEILSVVDALAAAGISIHLVKHENCAGFMAEGAYHHDGAPGILLTTLGPGILNATNVVANAWQDRVPLIVLTASVAKAHTTTYTHQVLDHLAVFGSITKGAFLVGEGESGQIADRAVALATEGRPGPVLIDMPIDVQRSLVSDPIVLGEPVRAEPADGLEEACEILAASRRPIVLAGLDCLRTEAAKAVEDFCVANRAPLITTYKAKGLLDEDHELSLGGAGLSPQVDSILHEALASADCTLLVGYDPIEMRIGWQNAFPGLTIDLGMVANDHGMHEATTELVGDIALTLDLLPRPGSDWTSSELTGLHQRLRASSHADEEWGPAAIADEACRVMPDNTVATADSGAHRIVVSQVWRCHQSRGLLQSTGLCTMGAAVPLAIGRKLAEPDRPVVAFVGDAGVEMFLGELATARDLGLGIPIVVFVDDQLALIELKQRGMGLEGLAVDFAGTDLVAVAGAMGGVGVEVRSRSELGEALVRSQNRHTFTLIAAKIGEQAYDGYI